MKILWLYAFFHWFMNTSSPVAESSVRVTVHNLRNEKGVILLSLYASGEGFPSDASKAVKLAKVKVAGAQTEVVLEGIPAGSYAIALLHDENNNGKMDTGMFGIPKEGYGASNDAKAVLGPPSFDDARFEHKGNTHLQIKMKYF
jgi:uncharacterized protein (DUF2141 family)